MSKILQQLHQSCARLSICGHREHSHRCYPTVISASCIRQNSTPWLWFAHSKDDRHSIVLSPAQLTFRRSFGKRYVVSANVNSEPWRESTKPTWSTCLWERKSRSWRMASSHMVRGRVQQLAEQSVPNGCSLACWPRTGGWSVSECAMRSD